MRTMSHDRPRLRAVSRRDGPCALYRYYYGYFADGAETV